VVSRVLFKRKKLQIVFFKKTEKIRVWIKQTLILTITC